MSSCSLLNLELYWIEHERRQIVRARMTRTSSNDKRKSTPDCGPSSEHAQLRRHHYKHDTKHVPKLSLIQQWRYRRALKNAQRQRIDLTLRLYSLRCQPKNPRKRALEEISSPDADQLESTSGPSPKRPKLTTSGKLQPKKWAYQRPEDSSLRNYLDPPLAEKQVEVLGDVE